jgi:RNA cap guanine-N2 methyltransferase
MVRLNPGGEEISMAEAEPGTGTPHYDRDFLLSPGKRNQVMALWEVERFGTDSFGDPDYVSIYGMRPAEWYARGVRLLARTTLEAVRDQLGAVIGRDVARRVAAVPAGTPFGVIDPFAGSCNGLFWLLRHVPNATARGFEVDETVLALTSRNLTLLDLDRQIDLSQGDYRQLINRRPFPSGHHLVVFLGPPWGDALTASAGLDLGRTRPPVGEIVDDFERVYPKNPVLYVVEAHERLVPESLVALRRRFTESDLQIYDIAAPYGRRAMLFGFNRWLR